jgi:probable HAF family extracellular repeat protein
MKRSVYLLSVILVLSIVPLFAGCGGGGGGNDGTSVGESTSVTEDAVKTKAQSILPSEEYSIFESRLSAISGDPNYNDYLSTLNQSMDNFINEFEKAQQNESAVNLVHSVQLSTLINIKNRIKGMKATLGDIFGNILDEGRQKFINARMGFSSGVLGSIGGTLDATFIGGSTVQISWGAGIEKTYNFSSFQKAIFPVSQCLGGLGITCGGGGGGNEKVSALFYEKWLFGMKKDIASCEGPSQGVSGSGGLEGAFGVGLGIQGGFGFSQGIKGSCDNAFGSCPIPSTDLSGSSAITYALGISLSGGIQAKAVGALSGSGTTSCTGTARETEDFLDNSLPVEIRYINAGFKMGTDILKNGKNGGFNLPAAVTAILYGYAYSSPTVEQTPLIAKPGDTVIQSGIGFTPNSTATLHFRKPDNSEFTPLSQAIGSDGTFSINYIIPTDRTPGEYIWWAVDISGLVSNEVRFTVASAVGYNVSGRVLYDGTGRAGLPLTLTGGGYSWTASTDSNGAYIFTDIPNGSYTVTPSLFVFSFNPSSIFVMVNNGDVGTQDVVATLIGYSITELPTLGGSGYSTPSAINNKGQVVGDSPLIGGNVHAFFYYSSGQMKDLGTLGGNNSYARGINYSGQVVGHSDTSDGKIHAFLYSGDQMKDLGTLGGNNSYAMDINDSGQVVGYSDTSESKVHAFIYSGGLMTDLGTLTNGFNSSAIAINSYGQIAGNSYNANGEDRAFLYSGGQMIDLGCGYAPYYYPITSYATDINDNGKVVGGSNTCGSALGGCDPITSIFFNGTVSSIPWDGRIGVTSWVYVSGLNGINNYDLIVGTVRYSSNLSQHAILYCHPVFVAFECLIDPSFGWIPSEATKINDIGQIIGPGYLMTPVNN